MSDELFGPTQNHHSDSQIHNEGFKAIKKQILWTSILQLLLYLVQIVVIVWYIFTPDNNATDYFIGIAVLICSFLLTGFLHTKVYKVKKRKFKKIVVHEEIAKKCQLQSYRHLPDELKLFPYAFLHVAYNHPEYKYALNDYIKGIYCGYSFRMMDYDGHLGQQSFQFHLIVINTRRQFENAYLHLCPFARFFTPFKRTEQFDDTPFFTYPNIRKKFMAAKAAKPAKYISLATALEETEAWEKAHFSTTSQSTSSTGIFPDYAQTNMPDPLAENLQQFNDNPNISTAETPYGPRDVLTRELAETLMNASKTCHDLNLHFEKDLLLVFYRDDNDFFEPRSRYALSSREQVGAAIQKELNKSFDMFDRLRPLLDHLSPMEYARSENQFSPQ